MSPTKEVSMTETMTRWEQAKADVSTPTEALGAALHRYQHPTFFLDGFACSCFTKAKAYEEFLREVGYEIVKADEAPSERTAG
jgi:hypothetical protein